MKQYFLKYSEFLNESLSSARKRFLETGKLNQYEFEGLVAVDPSPTKKYLDKICDWYIDLKDGMSGDEYVRFIRKRLDVFDRYNQQLSKRDINQYTWSEFNSVVSNINITSKTRHKKENRFILTQNSNVVFENENCKVVYIKNKEESKVLGAGTNWCISRQKDTDNAWNQYKRLTFYFITPKVGFKFDNNTRYNLSKMALGVNKLNGEWSEIRDFDDVFIGKEDFEDFVKQLGIPTDTAFKKRMDEIEKTNTLEKLGYSCYIKISTPYSDNDTLTEFLESHSTSMSKEEIREYELEADMIILSSLTADSIEDIKESDVRGALVELGIGSKIYQAISDATSENIYYYGDFDDLLDTYETLNKETINKIAKKGLEYDDETIAEMDEDDLYQECKDFLIGLGDIYEMEDWLVGKYKQSLEDRMMEFRDEQIEYSIRNEASYVVVMVTLENPDGEEAEFEFRMRLNGYEYV